MRGKSIYPIRVALWVGKNRYTVKGVIYTVRSVFDEPNQVTLRDRFEKIIQTGSAHLTIPEKTDKIKGEEYDPTVGKGNNLSRQIAVGESPIGLSRDAVEDYLCATTGKPISMCGCEGHSHHTTLIAELKNRDPRLLQTVPTPEAGEYTYYLEGKRPDIGKYTSGSVSTSTGYGVIKYYNPSEYTSSHHIGTLDAPIFRYAEILLIRAEAGAELGQDPELDKTINALRDRVGFNHHLTTNPIEDPKLVAEYPTIKGPNANLIREIRRERRIELALEGFRYDDIMRWNAMKLFENPKTYLGMRVTDKVKALYQPEVFEGSTARDLIEYNGKTYIRMYSGKSLNEAGRKWTGNDKRLYYPIPTSQITLSASHGSLLKQNPGWE